MLTGYKTYILASLAIIVLVLMHFGIIDVTNGLQILGLLGFGTVMALRNSIPPSL
jgi:hypothetical protein